MTLPTDVSDAAVVKAFTGIPALLQSARYQGDHYRLRVRLADATELDLPHHGEPPPDGAAIEVALRDGWVLG